MNPSQAIDSIPKLIKAMSKDSSELVRQSCVSALCRFEHTNQEMVLNALMEALSNPSPWVRDEAASSFGKLKTKAIAAKPILQKMLKEDSEI